MVQHSWYSEWHFQWEKFKLTYAAEETGVCCKLRCTASYCTGNAWSLDALHAEDVVGTTTGSTWRHTIWRPDIVSRSQCLWCLHTTLVTILHHRSGKQHASKYRMKDKQLYYKSVMLNTNIPVIQRISTELHLTSSTFIVLLFSVVNSHTEIIRIIFRLSYQPDSNFCYGRNNWGIHMLVHVLCTHTHAHAHTQTRSLLLLRLYSTSVIVWSWGSSVSIVSDYRVDDPVFNPRQRQRIFPLPCVSRTALRPTQLPIQWVPGIHSQG
jgi:hypothetical protein